MTVQFTKASLQDQTVGHIAATLPGASAIFRNFKIDFCCGGDVTLDMAAKDLGLDVFVIEQALSALESDELPASTNLSSGELTEYIQSRFHDTHRREIPELILLARKVEAVHRDNPKVPAGVATLLKEMEGELEVHMKKEELILFPAMRWADTTLDAPISQMRYDHTDHGVYLQRLAELTDNFTLPEGACRSWQALYAGLAKLTEDLQDHIHLENNVLFPRFETV
ncbi:iron-sulfur cluster repair di-iron protein [Sneathiella chungangensis]|uniref:Iron-sulfur cluster repair di-iron protein n=1 Tax=Sneathiella chungangensis TaxID=1418234 RepID=A0A845MHG8_9PROT|nr:iron-sulfur cluster repair di-iron protein [Sneathiella chungangensis]MZR22776.1 iron-sulfur cluster repair di-iron protein [Sneathiella chungangensis]